VRISVLASGSGGNLLLVATARAVVLIDAGLSPREFARRVGRLPAGPSGKLGPLPDALFITHEHSDHSRCASSYADQGVAVHATAGTRQALGLPNHSFHEVRDGAQVVVGDLSIEPVALPHDAAEPVGYVISDGVTRAGVLTDCGEDDEAVARRYAGVDLLVLEFNHDPMLLQAGPYPGWLKRRIASDRGHLSNVQAAGLLRRICKAGPPPRLVVLAHLSQVNNRPGIAQRAALEVMKRPSAVLVAEQDQPTPWLDPAAPGGRVDALCGEQLTLKLVTG
jgi:phosphoribosyl 1,2-cyclic phosphodiesterase